jgi:copper(I)-binding protein
MSRRLKTFIVMLASLFLCAPVLFGAGCTQGTPSLEIESSHAMLSPLILGAGSVFMTIVNKGSCDDNLVAVTSDIPGTITELHDVRDGKMAKIEKILVPRDGSVRLRPGGLHIMIFNLPRTMKEGDALTLTLQFEKTGEKRVPLQFTNNATPAVGH